MNVTRFLARDAADAVGQIRSRLGPDAVVVSVAAFAAMQRWKVGVIAVVIASGALGLAWSFG